MFLIDLEYIAPLEVVDAYMEVHLNHLKKYYDEKVLIVWGRKVPLTGGFIVANASSKEKIEKVISEDPFYKRNVAKFTITEFLTSVYHPDLMTLLNSK